MLKIEKMKHFLLKKWEIIITIWIVIIAVVILYSYFSSSNKNTNDVMRYTDLLKINDELKIFYSKNNT